MNKIHKFFWIDKIPIEALEMIETAFFVWREVSHDGVVEMDPVGEEFSLWMAIRQELRERGNVPPGKWIGEKE